MKNNLILKFALFLSLNGLSQTTQRWERVEKQTLEGTKIGMYDNKNQKEIIPAIYDKIPLMGDGKFIVIKDQRLGYIDTTGKIIIAPRFVDATIFDLGRAFAFDGKKWIMINEQGKQVGAQSFDDVLGHSEEMGTVMINNKVGYVNKNGVLIIPCTNLKGNDCYMGLIMVYNKVQDVMGQTIVKGKKIDYGTTKDLATVYNKTGAIVYRSKPDESIEITPAGKIVITKTTTSAGFKSITRSKLLDNTGKMIISYENNWYMQVLDYAIKIEVTDGVYGIGILDHDGKILLKPNFREIDWYKEYDGNNYAKVYFKENNNFFYVNEDGKCIEYQNVGCPK